MKTKTQAYLRGGYGWWETTRYPYGGAFRRVASDTTLPVILTGRKDPKMGLEFKTAEPGKAPRIGWASDSAISK